MDIEEAFTRYLLDHEGLKALINNKIYPEEIPQGTKLPAVFWVKISDIKDHTLTGQSELERPIYQFTAQGKTKAESKAVGKQIESALSDYQGIMNGVEVQKIEFQNEISSMEKSSDGTTKVYYKDLEFEINFIKV